MLEISREERMILRLRVGIYIGNDFNRLPWCHFDRLWRVAMMLTMFGRRMFFCWWWFDDDALD
jgi:hypothetical protein